MDDTQKHVQDAQNRPRNTPHDGCLTCSWLRRDSCSLRAVLGSIMRRRSDSRSASTACMCVMQGHASTGCGRQMRAPCGCAHGRMQAGQWVWECVAGSSVLVGCGALRGANTARHHEFHHARGGKACEQSRAT